MSANMIDKCFKLFHLDNRSSVSEVDIAYETLTKGLKDLKKIQEYRNAYEFLMCEHFCVVKKENAEQEKVERETWKDIEKIIPKQVNDSLDFFEEYADTKLSSKAKVIFSTQKVNLPMFFKSIFANSKKLFNFTYWTVENISNILKECCLNPIEYKTIVFELTTNNYEYICLIKELQKYAVSLQKVFKKNFTTSIFNISNTEYGVTGYVVVETKEAEHLVNMLKTKAVQTDCFLNLSTDLQ